MPRSSQDAYIGGVDALTNNPAYSGYDNNFLLTEPTDFAQAENSRAKSIYLRRGPNEHRVKLL